MVIVFELSSVHSSDSIASQNGWIDWTMFSSISRINVF